jgi:hypothetical protein
VLAVKPKVAAAADQPVWARAGASEHGRFARSGYFWNVIQFCDVSIFFDHTYAFYRQLDLSKLKFLSLSMYSIVLIFDCILLKSSNIFNIEGRHFIASCPRNNKT